MNLRGIALLFALVLPTVGHSQQELSCAHWIVPDTLEAPGRPCPIYLKVFSCAKQVSSATLTITAHGLYETALNGKRIGDAYFTPGYTNYDKRLQYQRYDVSGALKPGVNAITVTVGEGWYRGAFGARLSQNNYGSDPGLLCNLSIRFADGSSKEITSDATWRWSTGPILHSGIYEGEIFDARVQPSAWRNTLEKDLPKDVLVESTAPPVKKHEMFLPVKIFTTPKGEQVIDFGQNLAGWVQCWVSGKAGDTLRMAHAEVLDREGNFFTGNLREAKATDIYIMKGNGTEFFEPHFTYHGFRYVKVEGIDARKASFKAMALYSDVKPVGSFSCSNPLINQLQHNIAWSLKSNFLDYPSDCPQRSERLGWTADAQVFFRTAAFQYDVQAFFAKWLADLASEQYGNGAVPNVIPNIYRQPPAKPRGVCGWGDAAVITPWQMFWEYGDTDILKLQYASMKGWLFYIQETAKDDLWTGGGYGDWLAPGDSTSLPFLDQCHWAYSAGLMVKTALLLDKPQDAAMYREQEQRIRRALMKNYIDTVTGRTAPNTQTSYVLALAFDLLPDSLRQRAAAHLVALIKQNGNHLATGFLGTPLLLHALSQTGHDSAAYMLLNQDTSPSWLYAIKMGATTIWEKWNALKEDGTPQAISYNHYAYGAVGDWLYQVVAGISAAAPGYQQIIIRPRLGGGITWVKADHICKYGRIVSNWRVKRGVISMHVEIPAGTKAKVYVPGKQPAILGPGAYDMNGKI